MMVMMPSFVRVTVTHGYTASVQVYLNLFLTYYITLRYLSAAHTAAFNVMHLDHRI